MICPICGNEFFEPPALSRIDNKTAICPLCGTRQALQAAGFGEEAIEEIQATIYPERKSITIVKQCPMCGRSFKMIVDEDAYSAFLRGIPVQDAFSHFNPVEREFLVTGYCPTCQEKIFCNDKSNRIVKA